MNKLLISIFLITAVGIVAVAALIRPDKLGNLNFWLSVGWIVFLAALNWGVATLLVHKSREGKKSTLIGALPSMGFVVFLYSLISGSFLVGSWFFYNFEILPNWHLIGQIISFCIFAILFVLLIIASKAAEVNVPDDVLPKEDLIKKLQVISNNLSAEKKELDKDLKKLKEIIQYSVPHLASIKNLDGYRLLVLSIEKLEPNSTEIIECRNKIVELTNLAKSC